MTERREFVFLGHEAPTNAEFSLDDLPGAGRLDLLCRCINAALLTSYGVREETTAYLVLRGGRDVTLRFEGDEVRGLNPDERSIAGVVRSALGELTYYEVEASPGLYVAERTLGDVLDGTEGETVVLNREGRKASGVEPPEAATFVLSDHLEFTDEDLRVLEGARRLSFGSVTLHADHTTAVAHNWCDTEGYKDY